MKVILCRTFQLSWIAHCHLNRVRYLDFGFCHRNKQVDFATRVRDALSIFLYSVRLYGICPGGMQT
jgi:hypothetical protein